jgi:hypothetical protein
MEEEKSAVLEDSRHVVQVVGGVNLHEISRKPSGFGPRSAGLD